MEPQTVLLPAGEVLSRGVSPVLHSMHSHRNITHAQEVGEKSTPPPPPQVWPQTFQVVIVTVGLKVRTVEDRDRS